MRQKIFKTKIVNKLEEDIIINKEYYIHMKENPFWLVNMFNEAQNNNYEVDSKIEVEPFELEIGGPETDSKNAKIVYEHLKKLKPVQAVSSELWSYMTHIKFAEYMANRWPISDNDNNKIREVIKQRFFAIRGSKGIVRNGIARLWWAGYWGYDENRQDPYELVDVIFDKQEIYEHISERSYNRNKNILITSLDAIKQNDFNTREVRSLYGKINSYGSDKHLDALEYEECKKMINELVNEIKEENVKSDKNILKKVYQKLKGGK